MNSILDLENADPHTLILFHRDFNEPVVVFLLGLVGAYIHLIFSLNDRENDPA